MATERTALDIASEEAWLCGEAARLTEAFHARLALGDDSGCEEFMDRRSEILDRLIALDPPHEARVTDDDVLRAYRRESAEAIIRTLALDREVTALLEDRLTSLRGRMEMLRRRRESLDRYRTGAPRSASYADRLG
jgi:hypothetical protein